MDKSQFSTYGILFLILFQVACSSTRLRTETQETISPFEEMQVTRNSSEKTVFEKISVCNSYISATSIPIWYADDHHLFEKYGLDVEVTDVSSGSDAAIAMISGEFPICQLAGSPISNSVIAGEDLVYIAEYYNVFLFSLMVATEIENPEDLIGRSVAVTRAGSAQDTAVRIALRSFGLEPDIDVAIVNGGGDAEHLAALEANQVAGALFSPPTTFIVRKKGYQALLDLSALETKYSRQGLATTRHYLQTNRGTVINFMKAVIEGIVSMKKDPDGTRLVLAKHLDLDSTIDFELLNEAYDVIIMEYLRDKPYPTIEGIETVLSEISRQNPEAFSMNPEEIIDESILQEIENSGFYIDLE